MGCNHCFGPIYVNVVAGTLDDPVVRVRRRLVRLERLRDLGHELRRPEADTLRDGIRELRGRVGSVNYRLLYCIYGRIAAVLLHGLVKEAAVPESEIDLAIGRKEAFTRDPQRHTLRGWMVHGGTEEAE